MRGLRAGSGPGAIDAGPGGGLLLRRRRYLPTLYAGKYRQTLDPRGYVKVHLPKGHPYGNSGRWQYAHRLIVMEALGRRLATREQSHHVEYHYDEHGALLDELGRLEVLEIEFHGAHHAHAMMVAGRLPPRDPQGRFRELTYEEYEAWGYPPKPIARFGPLVGEAAKAAYAEWELKRRRKGSAT